ncbi:MAG: hypothetical protein G01um101448_912 [Parcubacteria group bacterium Gr01-1014_48]|nr:MAG: hypothetical protein G01um101448_912 [Parcubacteria group bacterium Gr01-1014_48]
MRFIAKTAQHGMWTLLIAGGILWFGYDIRGTGPEHYISGDTVKSYYFEKSQRLENTGVFPSVDMWDFAPNRQEENAPPLLAYGTVALYRLARVFMSIDFERFVSVFPTLIFGLWGISLFLAFKDLFNVHVALASLAVFAFMPISVELTSRGSYFQEVLGTWFLFLSIYFLLKLVDSRMRHARVFLALGCVSMTALILTWQQFPFFYAGLAVSLPALFVCRYLKHLWTAEDKRKVYLLGILCITPLILGEGVSRIVIGTGYSSFGMIGEFFHAFMYRHESDFLFALTRVDWKNPGFVEFYKYFGVLGFFAGIFGITTVFVRQTKRNYVIVALSLYALAILGIFTKDRFFAFVFLLYLFALGIETILNPHFVVEKLLIVKNWIQLSQKRFSRWRTIVGIGTIAFAVVWTTEHQAGFMSRSKMRRFVMYVFLHRVPKQDSCGRIFLWQGILFFLR